VEQEAKLTLTNKLDAVDAEVDSFSDEPVALSTVFLRLSVPPAASLPLVLSVLDVERPAADTVTIALVRAFVVLLAKLTKLPEKSTRN
jgi:hypothetical protein